uniref:Uncharacterized protein n=1 Tax=Rhizophora mucronata TaxID=61149 RepID=A0A2P2PZP1_RHIMU
MILDISLHTYAPFCFYFPVKFSPLFPIYFGDND